MPDTVLLVLVVKRNAEPPIVTRGVRLLIFCENKLDVRKVKWRESVL